MMPFVRILCWALILVTRLPFNLGDRLLVDRGRAITPLRKILAVALCSLVIHRAVHVLRERFLYGLRIKKIAKSCTNHVDFDENIWGNWPFV